ncbi:MAG TPA: acyl-CoA dehydratase activase [Candidatus Methylomirabilis sp.]|nr:acyl-CoA dehydratase activase [Candidatus Methylomirabilis sp.]
MSHIGINIGALTVKVVRLDDEQVSFRSVNHQGRPVQALQEVLQGFGTGGYYGVCGCLGHLSEVAATEAALDSLGGTFDAVASLGGETFAIYLLEGRRIITALSHNQCAAGSGEFFIQQIGRLGLGLEEAISRSFDGKVVPLAARCSVHCKSDITHKLNRHEASVEDILHTLHDIMAGKVVSLLEKIPHPVRELLLVGGLALNRALVSALSDKLPHARITILPESPYFEALGAALITRANPLYDQPNLTLNPRLTVLPPLAQHEDRATPMPSPPGEPSAVGPFVLGVDAGSTTTKAVLLDARTHGIMAWHYGRTGGDPVEATRQCLRALTQQVDNPQAFLVATTGSARELIGAYLGTAHVYNEIAAHATGAVHCDPEVDTIFEIGGQDAKYIFLRNRVPIDYAMNASCSAGTGSFLEECAQGDLGLALAEIPAVALRAETPVQFKSTCAAFINSDIRGALQEGYSHQDVAAGLVYAVAHNYLSKVKGTRRVGKKVLFQGGLAMNRAVGSALERCVGKPVVIPPRPELLGAVGVALLAMERAADTLVPTTKLADLAEPVLQDRGHFTCDGCGNRCAITRFEVGGRRFPFGGRCTRFENVRKHSGRRAELPDLVDARNRLVFAPPAPVAAAAGGHRRIGIPRALTAHSLYPLYSTFFSRLGMEVDLSDVDPAGALRVHSGFCFPVQIAHGAVLDLIKRGIDEIFLPQVSRMPNPRIGRDSYLCPLTQASPYVIAKAFPGVTILSPVLNFTDGYEASSELVDMAESQLGFPHEAAEQAYREAIAAQLQTEEALLSLGREALQRALEGRQPTILLVGRSYNAYPPEASQSVARKLSSMGVRVIPGDCLPQGRTGPTAWHYPNIILNAVALAKRRANLFLLYVSNFSCTIDAFTQSYFTSELGSKPCLLLEIDAHTADAGIQTRLEAFLDIIRNHHADPIPETFFKPAGIDGDGVITTSSGRRVPFTDPQVSLYFPSFSHYHSRAVALSARWLGLNVGPPIDLDRRQLEQGLQHTSGRECLPLPICIGQMLEVHARRRRGEVVGFYMARGGAPCVVDCYLDYFRQFIRERELEDLVIFDPQEANVSSGLSIRKIAAALAPPLTLADLFVEMEQTLRVAGSSDGPDRLRASWDQYVTCQSSVRTLKAGLEGLIQQVAGIPHTDPAQCPKVVVTGDFFLRFSPSFLEGIHERYARHGIILLPVGVNELLLYASYSQMASAARTWHLPADSGRAAALACIRCSRPDGRSYLAGWTAYRRLKHDDETYRALFRRTGLLLSGIHDIARLFRQAALHLSPTIVGEAIPTVGKGVVARDEGYDGILAIGPFNCLPFRVSEAILKPYCLEKGVPILTYESDGFSAHPAFLRQVDVHIQEVLAGRRGRDDRGRAS